jgi:Ras GTPase-activating-like protein IQGAP2/3
MTSSKLGTGITTERSPSAAETYGSVRRSLRSLPQPPNASPTSVKGGTSRHSRSYTIDETGYRNTHSIGSPETRSMWRQENEPSSHCIRTPSSQIPPRPKSHHSYSHSSPHAPVLATSLTAPELETFQKSSTRHLRTLSKFARSGESEEFSIDDASLSVLGLQGRRKLKHADAVRGSFSGVKKKNTSAWAAGNWMDKQREFLQAYEYLCHIGEAKYWIEDVIQELIPPIVQLEEALRDGVTLAEIVQTLYPSRAFRIFRHPKLQYRHSDNIALFFKLLDEVGLPEVFRFELIDLYEKKNIPKVIHCIHALSWLLYKRGIVNFHIGNLVGQLEFEHHELEQMQKGLDNSGVSMPSFSGMGASFGAEPEPEPEPEPAESEEDRIEKQLHENESSISDFQSQIRGAFLRLSLGDLMNRLWDAEPLFTDLQSRIRGDWTRQIIGYRLDMLRFAVNLQASTRGFLVRRRQCNNENWWRSREGDVLKLQNLVRGQRARAEICFLKTQIRREESGVKLIQAAIRGALQRKQAFDQYEETRESENQLQLLQGSIRGMLTRESIRTEKEMLTREIPVQLLQGAIRGMLTRERIKTEKEMLTREIPVQLLQGAIRGMLARESIKKEKEMLTRVIPARLLQGAIRGMLVRESIKTEKEMLNREIPVQLLQGAIRGMLARESIKTEKDMLNRDIPVQILQGAIRGMLTRESIKTEKEMLNRETPSIVLIQASSRALAVRIRESRLLEALVSANEKWRALQSMARGVAVRRETQILRSQLEQQTRSISLVQSAIRAMSLRIRVKNQRESLTEFHTQILNLQSLIRGFMFRNRLNADMYSLRQNVGLIANLQSLARGAILRRHVGDTLFRLDDLNEETVRLQALTRAMLVRIEVGKTLNYLEAEEDSTIDFQSWIRGNLVRSCFVEKRRYFRENMEKVIKVQSYVRAKIQGQAYKSLTSGKNPPVGTIKGFVHLLNDSNFDFDEEIEFERLRKMVVQQVRQNELADQYITQLDIKIALLVKNKITLDEVVKHQKHFGGHVGSLLPNTDISSKDPFDLKALNKNSRRKLEQYQVLFFLLQTQPHYLARLFRRLREQNTAEKEYERIKHLIMGLFGYSQKRREEYYLIKLIARSIKEEVQSCVSLQDYVRCNPFWNKLFVAYVKSPRDRKFIRDVLGTMAKEAVIDNPELNLESDPMQIYRSAISNEELRTGQRSRRRPDVAREEAIRDPETREIFIQHLQDLRDIADQFFMGMEDHLHRMPFGIRYISQQMYQYLLSQFGNEDPGLILQIVGQCIWRIYFQPAVLEPEKHGVIDRGLSQNQKRNLGEIAKVLSQVASGRLFGGENVYLQPLNNYIGESIQRLGHIWGNSTSIPLPSFLSSLFFNKKANVSP